VRVVDALDDLMIALDELYGHHLAAAEELAALNRDDELAGRLAGLTLSIGELFTALTRLEDSRDELAEAIETTLENGKD